MQDTTSGSRSRGRPKTAWMSNITSWTGLSVEQLLRAVEDRYQWRLTAHDAANLRAHEDGWRQDKTSFLNIFAAELRKRFPPRLNNVYTTLWNLKFSSRTCYHWVVREWNSRIYPTLTVASKYARFESSWLQRVGNTAKRASLIWNEMRKQLRMEWAKLDHDVTVAVVRQWCHRLVQISDAPSPNLAKLEATVKVG